MPAYFLEGQQFGRLTVKSFHSYTKWGQKRWLCECECGKSTIVASHELVSGHTQSCGCFHKEVLLKCRTTHGGTHERLFGVWMDIKQRCELENSTSYSFYGGRGIKLCQEWHDYTVFKKWALENGYSENAEFFQCTIDRIDVNGDYCPENCRWVPMSVQFYNKRNTAYIEWNGKKYSFGQLSSMCDIPPKILYQRVLVCKWPVEKAMNTPYIPRRKNDRLKEATT